jgi:hypothetical protein
VHHVARHQAGGLRFHDLRHSYATWLVEPPAATPTAASPTPTKRSASQPLSSRATEFRARKPPANLGELEAEIYSLVQAAGPDNPERIQRQLTSSTTRGSAVNSAVRYQSRICSPVQNIASS